MSSPCASLRLTLLQFRSWRRTRSRWRLIVASGRRRGRSSLRHLGLPVQREPKHHRRFVYFRVIRADRYRRTSQAALESHILLSVGLVRAGRSHARASGLDLIQDFALVGGHRAETAIVDHLEDEIAR